MKNLKVKIIYEANVVIDEFEEKNMDFNRFEKFKSVLEEEMDNLILAKDGRNESSDIDMKWEVE